MKSPESAALHTQGTNSHRPLTLIHPHKSWSFPDAREWWKYRDLLWEMVKRDLRVRYRQTVLGGLWIVLQPLSQSLVYALVFGLIARLQSQSGIPYVLFIFVNMLGWGFFAGTITRGINSLLGQSTLIKKVYFPRILIPITSILGGVADLLVVLSAVIVMALLMGVSLDARLLTLPFWFALLILVAGGVCFWLSALAVYYRDVRNASTLIIQLWMYLTPVVYSESAVPEVIRPIIHLNPATAPIQGIRWALLSGAFPTTLSLICAIFVGTFLFFTGIGFVRRVERNMVDII
jgi:lipopolysaccharide transport system permease protein